MHTLSLIHIFWDDHPAQIIYSSYDSCGFHLSVPPVLYDAIVGDVYKRQVYYG